MLEEFIEDPLSIIDTHWQNIMSGVRLCRFDMSTFKGGYPYILSPVIAPSTMEVLLCFDGTVMIERKKGSPVTVGSYDIMLLSAPDIVHTARIASPLSGILIIIDKEKIKHSFEKLNHLFLNKSIKQNNTDKNCHDFCVIQKTEWSRNFFTALKDTKNSDQSNYSVYKLIELFYLIHTENAVIKSKTSDNNQDGYLIQTINQIKEYMEQHLDEKITIDYLSRRFHISPTTLKSYFRTVYGQPVHQWLQTQRMEKAAALLHSSAMSVLQVAQSVGYEGISQFNVIFKRYYGVTPGEYRKMSNAIKN